MRRKELESGVGIGCKKSGGKEGGRARKGKEKSWGEKGRKGKGWL